MKAASSREEGTPLLCPLSPPSRPKPGFRTWGVVDGREAPSGEVQFSRTVQAAGARVHAWRTVLAWSDRQKLERLDIPESSHPATRENYSGQTPLLLGTVFAPEDKRERGSDLLARTRHLTPNLSASFLPEPPPVAAIRGGRGWLINGTHNVVKIREGKRKRYLIRAGRPFVLKQIKQPGIGKTVSLRQEKLLCSRNIKMIRESWYLKG